MMPTARLVLIELTTSRYPLVGGWWEPLAGSAVAGMARRARAPSGRDYHTASGADGKLIS